MFNLVNKIVVDLMYRIPKEILVEAFLNKDAYRARSHMSLDEAILHDVIRPRVMVDMNLVGGSIANIDLNGLEPELLDQYNMLFSIPPERTSGRGIVSVLSANFVPYASGHNAYSGVAVNGVHPSTMDVMSVTSNVFNSHANIMPIASTDIELVSPFSIAIRHTRTYRGFFVLRAILSYDEALNQINPRSYLHVTKLCEYACKSYIYNTMKIRIDRAQLMFGQELGAFREFIDGYADAEENYQTYLREVLQNVLFMNDRESHKRFMKLQIQPTI